MSLRLAMKRIKIVGGGLAGCEAAYYLLNHGYAVDLYEMRPVKMTPAHRTAGLAELVCSNSLKSEAHDTSQGVLKAELKMLGSVILQAAEASRVPAGGALAVDRDALSDNVMKLLSSYEHFRLIREEVTEIGEDTIIATGPLTSDAMYAAIKEITGRDALHFYDAVAPVITAKSVDPARSYYMSRYGKGEPDYLNCPMNKEEYLAFYDALVNARTVILKDFEKSEIFEGCMPVEVMGKRGVDALRFGPLRPVGLKNTDGGKAYAVLQLRREDNFESLMNLVGFQTNLTFEEQRRVFTMIPALKHAEFVRYGVMHRNTYIDSPKALTPYLGLKDRTVFFAGQITGVEGYMESAVSGILAAIFLSRTLEGKAIIPPPVTTMTGSLLQYVTCASKLSPMHVSFSLVPELQEKLRKKEDRKAAYAQRAVKDMESFINTLRGE